MISTGRVLNKKSQVITRQDILDKISDYDIYKHYVGDFKIGSIYRSPLREDKNPSFGMFVDIKTGDLLYKDLASGDCGDFVKFVQKLKGLPSYKDAIIEISKDMNIDGIRTVLSTIRERVVKNVKISVVRRKFNDVDIEFWKQFGISLSTLEKYQVNAIQKYISDNVVKAMYTSDCPMYSYKVFDKFKIYRPLAPKVNKWRGNLSALDIQGFEQLPQTGDLLVITKSLKDVMTLHDLGYNAIAPASESVLIPEIVVNNVKKRFKRIIIFYDRDKTGIEFTRKLTRKYNLDFFIINKRYKTKDISDFVKNFGSKEASELIKNI